MNKVIIFFLAFLTLFSCRNRNPNLSEKQLLALTKIAELENMPVDEEYVVLPGVKYKESRAIDPAQPPVVIDIKKALHQGAEDIPLSSIGKSVRYIKTIIPKDMYVQDFVVRDDTLLVSCRNPGATQQCIMPYTLDGKFLNIIWEVTPKGITKKYHPDIEEEAMPDTSPQNTKTNTPPSPPSWRQPSLDKGDEIIFNVYFDHTGKNIHYTITRFADREHPEYRKHIISTLNGTQKAVSSERFSEQNRYTYYLPSGSWAHVYKTLDQWFNKSPWSLVTFSSQRDTLCRFANYNPVTPVHVSAGNTIEKITAYFYNNRLTFRTDYADTIFRLAAPDRIIPVYAINCGKYKLLATEGLRNQIENKVYIENIRETQRFLFISINTPAREIQVLVFDKQQKTLRLHRNEKFSNDIDHGLAFYPEKIMPDGKTMACYHYMSNNPSDVMNRLFPSMAKNNVVFMIVQ